MGYRHLWRLKAILDQRGGLVQQEAAQDDTSRRSPPTVPGAPSDGVRALQPDGRLLVNAPKDVIVSPKHILSSVQPSASYSSRVRVVEIDFHTDKRYEEFLASHAGGCISHRTLWTERIVHFVNGALGLVYRSQRGGRLD